MQSKQTQTSRALQASRSALLGKNGANLYHSFKGTKFLPILASFLLVNAVSGGVHAADNTSVYQDKIENSWDNWSWGSSINFSNPSPVKSGDKSIWFKASGPWGGLYLHSDKSIDVKNYKGIRFSIKSTSADQKFQVLIYGQNDSVVLKKKLTDLGSSLSSSQWNEYTLEFSQLPAGTPIINGFALQDISGKGEKAIFVDEIMLVGDDSADDNGTIPDSGSLNPTPSPTPEIPGTSDGSVTSSPAISPTPAPTTTPSPEAQLGGTYTVSGGAVYRDGKKIKLQGASWFGFDGGTKVVHGLWARNYKDMIKQIKSVGINSVRVPFCPSVVDQAATSSINYSLNPDLKGLNSLQVLDKVMAELNAQGIHILLDHHNPDCSTISDLWYTSNYSEEKWLSDLTTLASRYKNLPYFMGLDIKNEPKGSATWGTGNVKTDWNLAAERAGKKILQANPNILIFVQGIQNNPDCTDQFAHFWGGNLAPASCKQINSSYIPADKLVFSPHVYGPDVHPQSYFFAGDFPNNMPNIWDTHFGYLADKGFAVVPGEWGGKYGNGGLEKDVIWQNKLTEYFKEKGICSSYYWDWNPNSTDTGGILMDDWKTVYQNKVDMLNNYWNGCNY